MTVPSIVLPSSSSSLQYLSSTTKSGGTTVTGISTLPSSVTTTTTTTTNAPTLLLLQDYNMEECWPPPPAASTAAIPSTTTTSTTTHLGSQRFRSGVCGNSSSHRSSSSSSMIWIRYYYQWLLTLWDELWESTDVLFKGRIVYMLLLGPLVVIGDSLNLLDKSICFALSGLALIPCAERLSFLTEQIAEHTNGTISALFNATFGNAPELLISVAALRAGYYRVIQLTMLGSMITNMIFVFGVSCIIGGIRYQTQSIRTTSGNVTIGMLLMSTAGSLIPATLVLSGQFIDVPSASTSTTSTNNSHNNNNMNDFGITRQLLKRTIATEAPTQEEITLSRVNASVLIMLYICYIIFQLGTHKDEFDDVIEPRTVSRPNIVCRKFCAKIGGGTTHPQQQHVPHHDMSTTIPFDIGDGLASPIASPRGLRKKFSDHKSILPLHHRTGMNHSTAVNNHSSYDPNHHHHSVNNNDDDNDNDGLEMEDLALLGHNYQDDASVLLDTQPSSLLDGSERHRRRRRHVLPLLRTSSGSHHNNETFDSMLLPNGTTSTHMKMMNASTSFDSVTDDHFSMQDVSHRSTTTGVISVHDHSVVVSHHNPTPLVLSFRVSVVWLFIITLCVSAISDILVDTIDEFAYQMNLSQVFTSMIIIPFFSNVAEQVSAFLFAYRNEMDLVVGVTIGSAIQIATFVLPGSVLIGYLLDRGMTLYFHSYETVCLLLCTLIVAAILQGGTTNWLVGAMLVGVYIMLAAGIWFHEIENLSIDTEELIDAIH